MSVETKQAVANQVSELIKRWLDTHYEIAKAANAGNPERLKGIDEMRRLRLDDYSYTVAQEIAKMFVEDYEPA